ncbi:hypothetical protein TNCV_2168301 [Trichonephila clavipes]|nr:hypothetical protein TNCV_2168301 [Trichonephila clavipes]
MGLLPIGLNGNEIVDSLAKSASALTLNTCQTFTEISSIKSIEFNALWRIAPAHPWTATAGSDVVQSGRPIFDDFFQHLWPYIGNNTANVVFQMVKRLWLIRIDQ